MKKTSRGFVVALLLFVVSSSVALALPIENTVGDGTEDLSDGSAYDYYQNSGTLLKEGVIKGNIADSDDLFAWLSGNGYSVSGLMAVDIEVFGWTESGLAPIGTTGDDGKLDDISGEFLSGTWSTVSDTDLLHFYTVKSSTYSAIYELSPADSTGSWSTYDIWSQPDFKGGDIAISHYVAGGSLVPVPEPSTVILLGAGLFGLAWCGHKRKKN